MQPDSTRVQFIDVGSKRVLRVDFSGLQDESMILDAIAMAGRFIASQPERSLYTLTDFTNTRSTDRVVEALKLYARSNKPYVRGGAIVGLRPVQRVLYTMVMKFSGRDLAAFSTLDEAKSFLTTLA